MTVTIPGTETKVTPEMEVPIIPKATIYHGDFLLPVKKAALEASDWRREVRNEMKSSSAK